MLKGEARVGTYLALVRKDPETDYGVDFPDFPGCITAGQTLDEAKDMALEALSGHIEVMREAGEWMPPPSSLDKVMRHPQFRTGVAFLVRIEEPARVNPG